MVAMREALLHGHALTGKMGVGDGFDRAVRVEADLGGLAHEGLEVHVAGHEVGLGIHLDGNRMAAGGFHGDEAFGGGTAGLLGSLGEALLAEPIDGGLDVAVGLGEGGLAVHHAGAGLFAQLLHQSCRDRGHGPNPSSSRTTAGCGVPSRPPGRMPLLQNSEVPREDHSTSAEASFAWAIQPSTRPGRPTSSPIRCASWASRPAI